MRRESDVVSRLTSGKRRRICSGIDRRAERRRLTGGEEEARLEAGALRLAAREDHGQLLALGPVRRAHVVAAQLVVVLLVHERRADVLALQVYPEKAVRTPSSEPRASRYVMTSLSGESPANKSASDSLDEMMAG